MILRKILRSFYDDELQRALCILHTAQFNFCRKPISRYQAFMVVVDNRASLDSCPLIRLNFRLMVHEHDT